MGLNLKINKNSSSIFAKEVQNQLNAYFTRKLKKFDIPVVPIFIERFEGVKFKMKIYNPIYFSKEKKCEIMNKLVDVLTRKHILYLN